MVHWKTSVSDHCCLDCTNTVYKADTIIDTIELEDGCSSVETQICRKLPGTLLYSMVATFNLFKTFPGDKKAKINSEFNYKACCNDNSGLKKLGAQVYQPSTCSQRTCFFEKYLPFSLWTSKQARILRLNFLFLILFTVRYFPAVDAA